MLNSLLYIADRAKSLESYDFNLKSIIGAALSGSNTIQISSGCDRLGPEEIVFMKIHFEDSEYSGSVL